MQQNGCLECPRGTRKLEAAPFFLLPTIGHMDGGYSCPFPPALYCCIHTVCRAQSDNEVQRKGLRAPLE